MQTDSVDHDHPFFLTTKQKRGFSNQKWCLQINLFLFINFFIHLYSTSINIALNHSQGIKCLTVLPKLNICKPLVDISHLIYNKTLNGKICITEIILCMCICICILQKQHHQYALEKVKRQKLIDLLLFLMLSLSVFHCTVYLPVSI